VSKKRSAKALAQRHDRAFAEFEARTRKLVTAQAPQIVPQPANTKIRRPTH